ncbi:hypothetical protein NP493_2593g00010 [Ridgeia piscesae]|uniref:Uncharacterized protein n=1 Tax=Ridgeia piscesae TaxID=27915 RepID=A0AAD9JFH0_RIDPI|nr:hypothetical protein NP493_2593g00010 [Ridgeia piscesae]
MRPIRRQRSNPTRDGRDKEYLFKWLSTSGVLLFHSSALDITSSFSTITSGRPMAGTGDRAENWPQFDNINCDKSNTDEWNNSTPDVDNHLNSTAPEPRTNSPVAMETNESVMHRPEGQCAYLSTSAPADLATEVSNATRSEVTASNAHAETPAVESASSEANVASVVADITLEVVRDSADDNGNPKENRSRGRVRL